MERFIAFITVATLLGGCGTTSIPAKDDSAVTSGLPVKSCGPPEARPANIRAFCPKGALEEPVQLRSEDIRACYEMQLKDQPGLSGKVDVSWTIGTDGRVCKISTTGLKEVGACVAKVIQSIQFQPPGIGCEVISKYPFVFNLN